VTLTDSPTVWLDVADAPAIAGLRFRRPRADDADFAAMSALVAAANGEDGIPYAPTASNLREEFETETSFDPATDIVMAEVDGRLVANAGSDRAVRDGLTVFHLWGHVDPAWRRRGLGRVLLRENVRRVKERSEAETDGVPTAAQSVAAQTEAGHAALLDEAGFQPIRWFFEMRRPHLDAIPEAPLPDGLELRPVTPELYRTIWEADAEAFQDHWQARQPTDDDFTALFAKEDLDTSLWVVAWDGDDVAGVVQTWIWRGENDQLGVQRGWLEHISVRRPWRRRGLGRALTAEALRRLAAAGMTEAMLGVDAENPTGALGLYESLDFEVHQRATAWQHPLRR
jgi:mycothiol synthase